MEVENRQKPTDGGLRSRFPKTRLSGFPHTGHDAEFAEKIEKLCEAKGALHSQYVLTPYRLNGLEGETMDAEANFFPA